MPECLRLTVPGAVGITGRLLWCRHVKQPARSRDVFRAPAIGEEAVVSNAVETVGQDVDQKAADELVDVECHPGAHPLNTRTPARARGEQAERSARERRAGRALGRRLGDYIRWRSASLGVGACIPP